MRLLQAEFDHMAQTKRCKVARFGSERPIDEHHQSQVVMYLQKKGHRLTDIWSVLRYVHYGDIRICKGKYLRAEP